MDTRLEEFLTRPGAPPDPATMAAIEAGPIDPGEATRLDDLDRLIDPDAALTETGWCRTGDGVGYVAVRTAMPEVEPEMVDWWFDWHPREPLRYRVWCPGAHESISFRPPSVAGAKPFWGAVHFPVEDVDLGMQRVRIDFKPPSEVGFSTDILDDDRIGTVVCGFGGDPVRRAQAFVIAHVFLRAERGLVLRSRFWLGAALRPYAPAPIADLGARLLNRPAVRRRVIPDRLPKALARHCATEFARLGAILPQLHRRYG